MARAPAGRTADLKAIEGELLRARDTLETRVVERTVKLARTLEELRGEVAVRKEAQEARRRIARCTTACSGLDAGPELRERLTRLSALTESCRRRSPTPSSTRGRRG